MGRISYSQYSQYATCPKRWKLNYIDKRGTYSQSIYTLFGTAMHEVLQSYLTIMYEESAAAAEKEDWGLHLKTFMAREYRKAVDMEQDPTFTDAAQMGEFYEDGIAIIDFFIKNRGKYFAKRNFELVGVEIPLDQKMECNENVNFIGYIDLVIKDLRDNTYEVIDIKTSTQGWNKYQKADKIKTSQLVLYKAYYAKQFDVPISNIRVKYFIVKRRLYENLDFPQKRVQLFEPAAGKPTVNQVANAVEAFVKHGFNADGTHNVDGSFIAIAGKNNKHCKYCDFKDNLDLCPKKERLKE